MKRAGGFSMIEVLVTLIVVALGLLGLAAMQTQLQTADFEAYQRAQAIVLVNDLLDRMNANRGAADCYAISTNNGQTPYVGALGGGHLGTPNCGSGSATAEAIARANADLTEWDDLLQGAAEVRSGSRVGAMLGARGCVSFDAVTSTYTVAVAWQGMIDTFEPVISCASSLYGGETKRRVVWTTVRMADLM